MNKLLDNKTGAFLVTSLDQREVDGEALNQTNGRIEAAKFTKFTVKLTHDAREFPACDYASEYDPAAPLVINVITYLNAAGNPITRKQLPSSEKQKWAFQDFSKVRDFLLAAGYNPEMEEQKYPLPNPVYIRVALAGTDNYVKDIGGPEMMGKAAEAGKKLNAAFSKVKAPTAPAGPALGAAIKATGAKVPAK